MKKLLQIFVFVCAISSVFIFTEVNAEPVENYQFSNEVTKIRFQALTKELRCPLCQNQNLADSNAPISKDLRQEIYAQLKAGKADSEIVNYMVERYGDFVLYRPQVSSLTYALWFGPAILLLFGVIVLILILRKKAVKPEELALSAQQKEKLKQILKD